MPLVFCVTIIALGVFVQYSLNFCPFLYSSVSVRGMSRSASVCHVRTWGLFVRVFSFAVLCLRSCTLCVFALCVLLFRVVRSCCLCRASPCLEVSRQGLGKKKKKKKSQKNGTSRSVFVHPKKQISYIKEGDSDIIQPNSRLTNENKNPRLDPAYTA